MSGDIAHFQINGDRYVIDQKAYKPEERACKAEPLTVTVPEAARILGIGRASAYEAARIGQIPTIKIGRRRLVARSALERLLDPERA